MKVSAYYAKSLLIPSQCPRRSAGIAVKLYVAGAAQARCKAPQVKNESVIDASRSTCKSQYWLAVHKRFQV